MCMVDDAESAAVCETIIRKARKDRQCHECFRVIRKGERYEHASVLFDGHWTTNDTCEGCLWAREWLIKECGGYLFGGVLEDLQQHHYEGGYNTADLLRRIVGIKKKWRGKLLERAKAKPIPKDVTT